MSRHVSVPSAGVDHHREEEMMQKKEGNAIIYCDGALTTTNGKTAHGLLRRSERYDILSVVDASNAGASTGEILRGCRFDVPILKSVKEAVAGAEAMDITATHLIVGLAPDGGRLPASAREHLKQAVLLGLHIVSGLHDFLLGDRELSILARDRGVDLIDIRRTPERNKLHFFSGKIETISTPRIAVLGTDSAVGKRTTAWMLVDAYRAAGVTAELVGTGQTAWLQGARFGVVFDALINDFVSGEIEHAVWSAWNAAHPEVIVVEGQGSLMNPAYPGGLEILAAARPACIVLQHAPGRREYDGFPGYRIHPIQTQIQALELISGRPVVAVTVNPEGISEGEIDLVCKAVAEETGLPVVEPIRHGVGAVVDAVRSCIATDLYE
jgi:uncharacterized NAD-dependent epimerase/dehydratase family protein